MGLGPAGEVAARGVTRVGGEGHCPRGPRLTVTVSPGRPWLVDCYDTWLQRLQVPVAAPSGPRLRQAQGPGGGTSQAVGWGELPGVNAGWGQAWDQGASQARAVC